MKQIKSKYYKLAEKSLCNYTQLKINIINMKEELDCLKQEDGMRAISYEGEKTSETNKISRELEGQAIRNINRENELNIKIKATQHEVNKIDRALEGLTDEERNIVVLRYIRCRHWYNIAYKVKYSERWCKHIRTQAIVKVSISLFGISALLLPESCTNTDK